MKNQKITYIIKLLFSIFLISVLILKLDFSSFFEVFLRVPTKYFIILIILYLLSVIINGIKWKLLLNKEKLSNLVKICYQAQFYSIVFPGQLFGEAAKIGKLHNSHESFEEIASSIIFDKMTGLIGITLVGFCGLLVVEINIPIVLRICFVVAFFLLILMIFGSKIRICDLVVCGIIRLLSKVKLLKRWNVAERISSLYNIWKGYAAQKKIFLISVLVGSLNQCIGVGQVLLISYCLGLNLTFGDYCWIMAALSILLLLPISFGGIGLREVSLSGFLNLYHVSIEEAIIISTLLFVSQFVAASIGGLTIMADNIIISKYKKK